MKNELSYNQWRNFVLKSGGDKGEQKNNTLIMNINSVGNRL